MLFFLFKSLSSAVISLSLGLLVMQTLYITNIFFFLIEQYFIDTLESILKLVFEIFYFIQKILFIMLFHTFWFRLLGNGWAH